MQKALEVSLAAAAAALFAAGCSKSAEQAPAESPATVISPDAVKCLGINECKGQAQCGVPGGHACAGQNECKGKGWVQVPADECTSKGGQVVQEAS